MPENYKIRKSFRSNVYQSTLQASVWISMIHRYYSFSFSLTKNSYSFNPNKVIPTVENVGYQKQKSAVNGAIYSWSNTTIPR